MRAVSPLVLEFAVRRVVLVVERHVGNRGDVASALLPRTGPALCAMFVRLLWTAEACKRDARS